LNFREYVNNLKRGFHPSFWVANIMELFERLAYYGQATLLSLYLRDHLKFNEIETGQLSSIFGGLLWMLPIFAGALADKFGFKKAFSFAFLVLTIGYFLIGSAGISLFSGFYSHFNLYWILIIMLVFTAIGGSFIKPSVLGTVALTSKSETKSFGYAIYYWLVNIGAAIGPLLAFLVRDNLGIEFVYIVSSISCALMFFSTLIFYKEPPAKVLEKNDDLITVLKKLIVVITNFRFIIFLLIFALYWVLFWQFFVVIPFYVADYISPNAPIEIIISIGAWTIICFQIPINRLTKNIAEKNAILIGFIFAASCWLFLFFVLPLTINIHSNILWWKNISLGIPTIMTAIFLFSIGEQTQAPRFYEYIADLAPKGQEALFQGFAFLPIAIAWGFGGTVGGWLYFKFATKANSPGTIFLVLFFVGILATLLMAIYNRVNKNKP
jgi:POT family proton-dependent oligopeptide transporter